MVSSTITIKFMVMVMVMVHGHCHCRHHHHDHCHHRINAAWYRDSSGDSSDDNPLLQGAT